MPVVPNPGIRIDGKLNNPKAATRKNLSTDMKVGRQNVFDYTDSAVSDGSTDARAAILAADAVGPVVLPPGTYAIASNMTLSNKITFDPGAKLKPASGITVTLSGGVYASLNQHIFDESAGGSINVDKMPDVRPDWWGANPSESDNVPFIEAALRNASVDTPLVINEAVYNCRSTFNITSKTVSIQGSGTGSKLQWKSDFSGIAIDISSCPSVKFQNLSIAGENVPYEGIYARVTTDTLIVDGCHISGFCGVTGQAQIMCEDLVNATVTNCVLENGADISVIGKTFTANSTTDVITSTAHGFINGDGVIFRGTDLPAGLIEAAIYFVREKTDDTFKVEKVPSTSAVDLTDNGSGTLKVSKSDVCADITFYNCQNVVCVGNASRSKCDNGIVFGTSVDTKCNAVIVGNLVENHLKHGIVIAYGNYLTTRMVVCSNRIHNCGWTGIYQSSSAGTNVGTSSISNNVITNCSGRYFYDQAGNAGIYLGGLKGGTVVGNVIHDCGFDIDGNSASAVGRGIFVVGADNVVIGQNQIKSATRAAIELSTGVESNNVNINGNILVDAPYLITLVHSGVLAVLKDICIRVNTLHNKTVDGHGIYIAEYAGGIEIECTDNSFRGMKQASTKAAIYSVNEIYANSTFEGNKISDWDYGFYSNNDTGTEEDFAIGIRWKLENNTFDSVTTCFGLRSGVYHAVGRRNRFVNCEPGFSATIMPAVIENESLVGFYHTSRPTRKCRVGDYISPLDHSSGNNLGYYNSASVPTGKAFTNTGDTLTITGHGYSVGDRLRASGGSLPTPMKAGKEYYVKSAPTADTLTLTETVNGLTLTLTTNASGTVTLLDYTPTWTAAT